MELSDAGVSIVNFIPGLISISSECSLRFRKVGEILCGKDVRMLLTSAGFGSLQETPVSSSDTFVTVAIMDSV